MLQKQVDSPSLQHPSRALLLGHATGDNRCEESKYLTLTAVTKSDIPSRPGQKPSVVHLALSSSPQAMPNEKHTSGSKQTKGDRSPA